MTAALTESTKQEESSSEESDEKGSNGLGDEWPRRLFQFLVRRPPLGF